MAVLYIFAIAMISALYSGFSSGKYESFFVCELSGDVVVFDTDVSLVMNVTYAGDYRCETDTKLLVVTEVYSYQGEAEDILSSRMERTRPFPVKYYCWKGRLYFDNYVPEYTITWIIVSQFGVAVLIITGVLAFEGIKLYIRKKYVISLKSNNV